MAGSYWLMLFCPLLGFHEHFPEFLQIINYYVWFEFKVLSEIIDSFPRQD